MLLPALELTASGRPKLLVGEVEHAVLEKADLQFETSGGVTGCIKRHEDGFAILTTHRLIWVDAAKAPAAGASCYLSLASVESLEVSATKVWTQNKLRIRVHLDSQRRPIPGASSYTQIEELRLISRQYGNFAERAQTLLYQRAWERSPPAASHPSQGFRQQPQAGSAALPPGVDQALLTQLTGMGFSHNRAARACQATNSSGAEQALQWLFEHEHDPGPEAALPGSQPAQPSTPLPSATSSPGIMGILRREEEIAARNDRTLDEAFQDLRGLMAKAQEMVQLAEKFRGTLAGKGGAEAQEGETLDADMQRQLLEIGIASPVTREVAGALYHQQLSRQLADFLGPRMQKAGGLVTLADVYCLFNRARGTELISPDDLLHAVDLFPAIGAGMHLRTFASGVLVVQSNTHDDNEVCAHIAGLVAGAGMGPPLSATEVAAAMSVPLTIAAHHLATAESKAILCRDDGPEGLRFFRNFFEEIPMPC